MSDKVVDLEEFRLNKNPHNSGLAECMLCKHQWTAVAPTGVVWLECPECGTMKGHYLYHCEREGSRWVCGCGNELFSLTPEGILCPNCGAWQAWPPKE